MKLRSMMLLLMILPAFGEDRVITPEDVARLKSVGAAALSPDGQTIAYTLSVPRELFKDEDGSAYTELHVWTKERGSRPFITGKVNVSSVKWTPDGKGLSFLIKRGDDKHKSLYVIPIDGGEATKVLSHKTSISKYEWANNSRVVFTAREKEDPKYKEWEEMGFHQEIYEEELLSAHVWVADLGEKADSRKLELKGHAADISVSPDGKKLAVALTPTSLVDDTYMYKTVHMLNTEDGSLIRKVERPGKLGDMRWSPDGKHLAMISAADLNDPSAGRLFVADTKDSLDKYFMKDEGDVTMITWRDNDTIHYLWDEGTETILKSLKLGKKPKKELATKMPWPSLSSAANRVVLVGDTPSHPRELFLWEEGNSSAERLTNSNPWLDEIPLAQQEMVTYKARDGVKIQGLLVRPLNEKKGQKYPLIMVVHGGPEAHFRNGWLTNYSQLGQMAAARDFAVFYPNYRASTGRGVAFSKMDHGRPAMEEFDDLVDAITHLSDNMGLVDKKKVGVTGGSYGGYATAWCSTALTEHFAAGVMFVGISNKISKMGTSDIPDEVYHVHDRHRLWEDWDLFLKQSPIYHVEKANTPLLIMHGKKDPRVPPSQSLELYRNLKILGKVPVRLVWYPDEEHGNRKAAARYDYNLRSLRWMEHYLKGEGGEKPPKDLDYNMPEEDSE